MFGLQRKEKSDAAPRWLQGVFENAEHTSPHYGLGHPPMQTVDPTEDVAEPPVTHDDRDDPTSLVEHIKWLTTVVETFNSAISRREQAHADAIAKAELEHSTSINKLMVKKTGYQARLEEKITQFAAIAKSVGITADDLRVVTERPDSEA